MLWIADVISLFVLGVAHPYVIKVTYETSQGLTSSHRFSRVHLKDGWFFGLKLDNRDLQWRSFRDNFFYLAGGLFIFLMISKYVRQFQSKAITSKEKISTNSDDCSYNHTGCNSLIDIFEKVATARLYFSALISGILFFILHGGFGLLILIIMVLGFTLSKLATCYSKYGSFLIWGGNVSMLMLSKWLSMTSPLWWRYIDSILSWPLPQLYRWDISVNLIVLRIISFSFDMLWSKNEGKDQILIKKHKEFCEICSTGNICYQRRQIFKGNADIFSFTNYVAYVGYFPLYVAGPIISFNGFMSFMIIPSRITATDCFKYTTRLFFSLILLETASHLMYPWALIAYNSQNHNLTMEQILAISYVALNFIWLKFLVIWRFFRMFALWDGIEAPENMTRCLNNNHSFFGFWKSWHASFNIWLIRYMYIPMGGSRYKWLNIWVIFGFVGLWHDLEFRLIAWSFLVCLFLIPEILAAKLAQSFPVFGTHPFRVLGGSLCIFLMMTANLLGFGMGTRELWDMLARFCEWQGLPAACAVWLSLASATHVMLRIETIRRDRAVKMPTQ